MGYTKDLHSWEKARVRPGVLKDETVEDESAAQQGGLEWRGATVSN